MKNVRMEMLTRTRIDPTLASGHYNLGSVHYAEGRFEEDEASYRRAIEFDPTFAAAHYYLGDVLDKLGKHEEAEEAHRRAKRLDPLLG